jgi:hypothetical protein
MFDNNGFKCEPTVRCDAGENEIELVHHRKTHFLIISFGKTNLLWKKYGPFQRICYACFLFLSMAKSIIMFNQNSLYLKWAIRAEAGENLTWESIWSLPGMNNMCRRLHSAVCKRHKLIKKLSIRRDGQEFDRQSQPVMWEEMDSRC